MFAKFVLGVTGEPGAGKSYICQALIGFCEATVINADAVGHELLKEPTIRERLIDAFGAGILTNREINRHKLAEQAFLNKKKTKLLNAIMHPALAAHIAGQAHEASGLVVIDCALLHELGLEVVCDKTMYVEVPFGIRLSRVHFRGWKEVDLRRREAALGDPKLRKERCHFSVIGTLPVADIFKIIVERIHEEC